ncbi:MAG TPA: dihydroorotate dehydrogenase electron transfer subunit [Syntrophaceae bacterium]|nr:dihydroorotate dehydrogenase electron transfer subunit [Syntrophaceae bacterium]
MFQVETEVVFNHQVGPSYYKIGLRAPEIVHSASPGQFVMVRVSSKLDPLLRRPFSIHRIAKKDSVSFEILYKVVGKGTEIMSSLRQGDGIDVMGPLGKGFSILPHPKDLPSQIIYLVSGGMGIAPLYALAESAVIDGRKKVAVFLGGKTKEDILCLDDLKRLGVEIHISTEDGSLGSKGVVTQLLEERLQIPSNPEVIYACGPIPMLKKVSLISQECHIPCQVSLEAYMACGVGACLGCVIKKRLDKGTETYVNVCKEGPVFDAHAVKFP